MKKLIKRLEAARGNGTSMISLIIRTFAPAAARWAERDAFSRALYRALLMASFSAKGSDLACGKDVG